MFTGIVEEIGRLASKRERGGAVELVIESTVALQGAQPGDSIAVDGCCLTVESLAPGRFTAFVTPETLARTTLAERAPGAGLNLEPALTLQKSLGGHLVQGHVDGTGRIASRRGEGAALIVKMTVPGDVQRYVVERGFIAAEVVHHDAHQVAVVLPGHLLEAHDSVARAGELELEPEQPLPVTGRWQRRLGRRLRGGREAEEQDQRQGGGRTEGVKGGHGSSGDGSVARRERSACRARVTRNPR